RRTGRAPQDRDDREDHREDDQHVDPRADRIAAHQAEQPQHHQQRSNHPKHGVLPVRSIPPTGSLTTLATPAWAAAWPEPSLAQRATYTSEPKSSAVNTIGARHPRCHIIAPST